MHRRVKTVRIKQTNKKRQKSRLIAHGVYSARSGKAAFGHSIPLATAHFQILLYMKASWQHRISLQVNKRRLEPDVSKYEFAKM